MAHERTAVKPASDLCDLYVIRPVVPNVANTTFRPERWEGVVHDPEQFKFLHDQLEKELGFTTTVRRILLTRTPMKVPVNDHHCEPLCACTAYESCVGLTRMWWCLTNPESSLRKRALTAAVLMGVSSEDVLALLRGSLALAHLRCHSSHAARNMAELLLLCAGIEPNPGPQAPRREERRAGQSHHVDTHRVQRLQIQRRRDAKAAHTVEFLRSGGELNPGPRQARVRRPGDVGFPEPQPKAVVGKKRVVRDEAITVLAQAAEDELLRENGAQDARDEIAFEERVAELAKNLECAVREAGVLRNSLFTILDREFHSFAFHPILEQPLFKPVYGVASNPAELPLLLWPHRVVQCSFASIDPAGYQDLDREKGKLVDVSRVLQTPQARAIACAKGDYHTITFRCNVQSYGFGGARGEPTTDVFVRFSYQQFCAARAARINRSTLYDTYTEVRSYRAQHRGYPQDDLDPTNAGYLTDSVFAACLMMGSSDLRQDVELLAELGYKAFVSKVFKQERTAAGDMPAAGGFYVRGYTTHPGDIFPDDWRDCMTSVAKGVPCHEAAETFLSKTCASTASVVAARYRDTTKQVEKSWKYCRALPGAVKNIMPCFPDPTSRFNQLIGSMKRLIPPMLVCDEEAEEREMIVAEWLSELPDRDVYEDDDVALEEHLRTTTLGRGWSLTQTEAFMEGAHDVLEAMKQGPHAVEQFFKNLTRPATHAGVFVKPEPYPADKVKAVRFIVAPMHYVRGVADCLLYQPMKRFFNQIKDHCVKGRTPDENLKEMKEWAAEHEGPDTQTFESDFSSYESLINARRRMTLECRIMKSYASLGAQAAIQHFQDMMSREFHLTGEFFTLILESIRQSGEFGTSFGNATDNVCMSFGAISRALNIKKSKMKGWLDGWSHPWRVEGDDGWFILPRTWKGIPVDTMLQAMYKKAGARVEMAFYDRFGDANFCGNTLVECSAELQLRYVDPLEKLASLTHSLACDPDSYARDLELLVAKAMSYALQYPGLPIVYPYCNAILAKNRNITKKLLDDVVSKKRHAAAAWLMSRMAYSHGAEFLPTLQALNRLDPDIPPAMRARVAEQYPGLTPEWQERVEQQLCDAVQTMDVNQQTLLDIPVLTEAYSHLVGARRMTVMKIADLREKVKERVMEGSLKAGKVYASGVEGAASGAKRIWKWAAATYATVFAAVAAPWCVGAWAAVVGTTGAGLLTGFWAWLITIPLLMLVAIPVSGLLITPLIWLFLIAMMGLTFTAARRVTAGFWWGITLIALISAAAQWRAIRAAASGSTVPAQPAQSAWRTRLSTALRIAGAIVG